MQNSRLVLVYSTPKPAEVALIKSLLDAERIRYSITNENFNTLYGAADGLTSMDIMVCEDRAEEARELLRHFIRPRKET